MPSQEIARMYPDARSPAQSKLFHYVHLEQKGMIATPCRPRHKAIALLEHCLVTKTEPELPEVLRGGLTGVYVAALQTPFNKMDHLLAKQGLILLEGKRNSKESILNTALQATAQMMIAGGEDPKGLELGLFSYCTHAMVADFFVSQKVQIAERSSLDEALRMYLDLWPEVVREKKENAADGTGLAPLHRIFHGPAERDLSKIRASLGIGGRNRPAGW